MGGACCSMSELASHRGISGDADETNASPDWSFPMCVVSVRDFLQMEGPPRTHQLLVQENKAVIWQKGFICIFISHQWLSHSHPDSSGKQMRVVRQAMQALLQGDVTVEVPCVMEAQAHSKTVQIPHWDRQERVMLNEAYAWYDYYSIPQMRLDTPSLGTINLLMSRS